MFMKKFEEKIISEDPWGKLSVNIGVVIYTLLTVPLRLEWILQSGISICSGFI